MDFHEQRARDLIRSETRPRAVSIAQRTRGVLDRYVSSRRLQAEGGTVTSVRWGRVLVALGALALLMAGASRLLH
jgi:hypothetical protein